MENGDNLLKLEKMECRNQSDLIKTWKMKSKEKEGDLLKTWKMTSYAQTAGNHWNTQIKGTTS